MKNFVVSLAGFVGDLFTKAMPSLRVVASPSRLFPIAALAAFSALFTAGHVAAQNILVDAEECVKGGYASDGHSFRTHWNPRYRFTNNCDYTVKVIYKHNEGETTGRSCGHYSTTLRAGQSERVGLGLIPRGVKSGIRWCAHYTDGDVQDRTGYKDCYEADRPSEPSACR